MKILAWRVTSKNDLYELDTKQWRSWLLWSGNKVGAAAATDHVVSVWAIKLLIYFVLYKSLKWVFDAFEIPILGNIASLMIIVIAFDELILTPLSKLDEIINNVNEFVGKWSDEPFLKKHN